MQRFNKRSEPDQLPTSTVTIRELTDQRSELEARVRDLVQQRHQPAFDWAQGNDREGNWRKITEIDSARTAFSQQIESLSMAINMLAQKAREENSEEVRFKAGYLKLKPRKIAFFNGLLHSAWASEVKYAQQMKDDKKFATLKDLALGQAGHDRFIGWARIPAHVAAEVVGLQPFEHELRKSNRGDEQLAQRIDYLDRMVVIATWCRDDLLASVDLPEMPEELAKILSDLTGNQD